MSSATYAALEQAIRDHIADESGEGIVTDWYLIAAQAEFGDPGEPDSTSYTHIASHAPMHTLHGLVDLAHRRLLRNDDTSYE